MSAAGINRVTVDSPDKFDAALADAQAAGKPVYVLVTGAKVDGVSWCPDCTYVNFLRVNK